MLRHFGTTNCSILLDSAPHASSFGCRSVRRVPVCGVAEHQPTVEAQAESTVRLVCNPVRYQSVRLSYKFCITVGVRTKLRGSFGWRVQGNFRSSEAEECGILSVLAWMVFTRKTRKVLTIHVQ